MVQEGMSAFCAAKNAKAADKKLVAQIFGSAGSVLELSEKHFDAVTARALAVARTQNADAADVR